MQAPQAQAVDNDSEQMQERWVPFPSQLELELRCRIGMMEIDRRIEVQRGDEYRRLLLAMVGGGGGYPQAGQLLLPLPGPSPRPAPASEREIMPVPSPSALVPRAGHPAALPVPYGAVAQAGSASATWERYWASRSSFVPSSASSRLSDDSCSSRRGRGRGRGGREGPGRRAGAVASGSSTRRLQLVCVLLTVSSALFSFLSL
jgi:hypothetical protein